MLSTIVASPIIAMWLALGVPADAGAKAAGDASGVRPAAGPELPGVEEKPGAATADHMRSKKESAKPSQPEAKKSGSKPVKAGKTAGSEKKEPPKVAPRPELSEELAAVRDRARYSLANYLRQSLTTRDYTAGEILLGCLPYGCQTQVSNEGQSLNGITCLCWNYPCAGYELLAQSEGHIAARVGYGLQSQPGQLLGVLALSRVPHDYPMRAGTLVKDVGDLVEYEKLSCRAGAKQSYRLIGLAHYVPKGQSWKNSLGETWSVERLVEDELSQPMATAPEGGTMRLVGLSVAVSHHAEAKPAPRKAMTRAAEFLAEYQRYALQLQNPDGSWHPSFFAATGTTNDPLGQLRSTGYIVSWLAISLPEDQLTKPGMQRAIDYLAQSLGTEQARWDVSALSKSGFDGLMQAMNALVTYDLRVFKPFDPPEDAKPSTQAKPAD